MRRWPSYSPWRAEERKRLTTEVLCRIAEWLPDWKIGSLPDMKFFASTRSKESARMSVSCPPGVSIRPAFISYYDLFFTEDFSALQQGMSKLCSEHKGRSQPFISSPGRDFEELFRSWSRRPVGGSWKKVGHFQFENNRKLICTKSVSIDLISISPVCVLMHASAFPQENFVNRFREMISQEVEKTGIIHRFGIFSRKWLAEKVLPSRARQHQLEELFLEINREVVNLLREYVGRGWSAIGPLPSFQVFALDECDEESANTRSEFWRSLSLRRTPEMSYNHNDGLKIVPPWWIDKGTFTEPYRCVVDTKKFLTEERMKMYATKDYAMYHNMEYDVIFPLLPLLALRESAMRTLDKLGWLRDRVSPHIVPQKGLLAKLKSVVGLLFVPPRLNSLEFEAARTRDSSVQSILDPPPHLPFTRKTLSDKDDGTLAEDLVFQIRSLSDHVKEHLGLIRNAYHDLWNFTIQWILIMLTVAAIIIAVVQILPEQGGQASGVQETQRAEQDNSSLRAEAHR